MGLISLFSFPSSQLMGMRMHTQTHTLISPVSIEQFLLMTICACLENQAQQNYTVTSYTITLISLFRTKKKISLTSTCPWIVMYLWTLYQWSLMKGIHIAESNRVFGMSWDWCQRGNLVECVCSRLLWKKWLLEIILAGVGETEELLTEVQCWSDTQLRVLTAIQHHDRELTTVPLFHPAVSGWNHVCRLAEV